MAKHFKKYRVFALILLFLVTSVFNIGTANADEGKGTIMGGITGLMKIPKSEGLKAKLRGIDIAKGGWFEAGTTYQKKVRFNKATVIVAGIEAVTDENGLFMLENVPAGTHTIRVFDIERKLLAESTVRVDAGKVTEKNIRFIYDVGGKGCCGDKANCCNEDLQSARIEDLSLLTKAAGFVKESFTAPIALALYPCRDYNGPYGNCVNYDSGTQKYINFIGSD